MAALLMKSSISKIPDIKTKNKYVIIHGSNFSIWLVLYSIYAYGNEVMGAYKGTMSNRGENFITIVFMIVALV